jgi:pimeloyl-ACP methyl ester carboxylesterase
MNAAGTIVFSHANGFPAGCYRLLFEIWQAAGWQVQALPQFGHDPAYPVSSNWPHLRDQLIHFIEREVQPAAPVMLVGHSLGGIVSLLAACRRPDLAAGLLLIDSPIVGGWRAHSVQVMKATRLMPKVSPGKISRQRRHEWPTRAAVLEHFAAKHKFAPLPHHLDGLLRRHPPRCPVGFLAGTQSEELHAAGAAPSKALAHRHFAWLEGTHLFPFERPDDTAAAVLQMLEALAAESRTR